jgi:hypothetical protein
MRVVLMDTKKTTGNRVDGSAPNRNGVRLSHHRAYGARTRRFAKRWVKFDVNICQVEKLKAFLK